MKNHSIIRNSIFNVAYTLINIFLPLLTSVYTSRILLPVGIGRFTYVGTVVSLFMTFAALGLPNYGVKIISLEKEVSSNLRKTFSELFIINAISSTFAIVCYILFLIFFIKDSDDYLLYYVLGIQLFFSYFNVDWYFGGTEHYEYITIRSFIIKVISVITLFIFIKTKDDLIIYALISSLSCVLNFIVGFISVKIPLQLKNLDIKRHIKPILFLSLTLVFSTIYSRIDVIMLKHMIGESSVGIYNNAHKIVNIVISSCTAITAVFLPRISYLFKKDRKEFDKLITNGLQFLYFITVPACVGLSLLSNDLIMILYGDEFSGSIKVMIILSLLIVIQGIGGLTNYQVIICAGKESVFVPTTLASMILNVILNYLFIPKFLALGAAIASVICELLLNSLLCIYVYKTIGYNPKITSLFKSVFSAMVMSVVIILIKNFFSNSVEYCIIAVISGFIIYLVCNVIFKNDIIFEGYKLIKNKIKNKNT